MVSRIQRRFPWMSARAVETPEPARLRPLRPADTGDAEPADLLAQVRTSIVTLNAAQARLDQRAQELLAEASGLYDALQDVATELTAIRRKQELAADRAAQLRIASQRLAKRRSNGPKKR